MPAVVAGMVLLVGAVACSSSGSSSAPTASPSTRAPSTAVSRTPSRSATGDTAGAPAGAQVLGQPHVGEPFTLTIPSGDSSPPTRMRVTVDSVTCNGLDPQVLAYAADSTGASTTPTPTPEAGKKYCVLAMTATNVGTDQANWDADNTVSLNVGGIHYQQSQDDAMHALDYEQYWHSKGQIGPAFGINPNSTGPVHGVFQIPTADTPTSVWVSSGSAIRNINGVQPGYLVALPPTQ